MSTKSCTISLRVPAKVRQALERMARRSGRSLGEIGARMVEEQVRMGEFAGIEFRDTAGGRDAFLRGTRLKVWMVVKVARQFDGHAKKAAAHLSLTPGQVHAALYYAEAFPEEIQAAIEDNDSLDLTALKRRLPGLTYSGEKGNDAKQLKAA